MNNPRSLTVMTLLTLVLAAPAAAVSPWLPSKGSLETGAYVIYQQFEDFYKKEELTPFPFKEISQVNTGFELQYGILENLSFDLQLGYVRTFSDRYELTTGQDLGDAGGLDDVRLGMTWQLLDEFEYENWLVPTVALRFGGIIAGTYEINVFPGSAGDKGSGFEVEFGVGKILPYGFGLAGTLGLRERNKNIPLDWHLRVDGFWTYDFGQSWLEQATLGLAYDQVRSVHGCDVGVPESCPAKFGTPDYARRLKEVSRNIEAAVGVMDGGKRYYNLFYSHVLSGRNVGKSDIVGFTITVPWQLY